jgi:Cu2+-exporting ATPase
MGNTVKESYPVGGLSCASCAMSVENILKEQKGVVSASVNYANLLAYIEYDVTTVSPNELKSAVQAVGYDIYTENNANSVVSDEHIRKYKQLKRNTSLSIIFSLPLVIMSMVFMQIPYANYIMWVLATPVLFWFGRSFFINAFKLAKHGKANMDTLVALSTGISYIFSIFNTIYPEFWHSRGLHAHVYFEASAVVITFILLGKLLEDRAKSNTSAALKKLIGLQPVTAHLIDNDGNEQNIPIHLLQKGQTILVKPGERIPLDGIVTSGQSFVDESSITGEPIPVEITENSKIYAGTLNQKGSFRLVTTSIGSDTILARIIKMVQEAQGSKPPVQKLVDKIASIFVPVVLLISVLSFLSWIVFGGIQYLPQALMAMVTVLVIACPCALGLATPTAIMVGIGKGAEKGILIKDAESLEIAQNIQAIVLDKTGTITEGHPKVTDLIWISKENIKTESNILYSIEGLSEHPLAEAVCKHLQSSNCTEFPLSNFKSITGKGVEANFNNELFLVGNSRLLQEQNILISQEIQQKVDLLQQEAKTVTFFAQSNQILAIIAIADTIKQSSISAIRKLTEQGIEVYMLTGDNTHTARIIAAQAGIDHFKAEVLPSEKAEFIKELQLQNKITAMVGDGINDSHALAQADVSIAMGSGSDIAIDVAKITIISSNLEHIAEAITLSKQTVKTIKQNLFWAFIYNIIGIPIAAGILYPINGFTLSPMIAGAAMALSSVSVVTNSLRIRKRI